MSTCSACAAPSQEIFYSPSGDALCRACYSASQIQAQDQRAALSLAASAPGGLKVTAKAETPEGQTRNGFLLLGTCVVSVVLSAVLLNRVYLWSGILALLGLGAFARALNLKKQQRQSVVMVVVGITVSVVVLLGLVAVTLLPA